jgi:MYXO-CTERM domain-containing protein
MRLVLLTLALALAATPALAAVTFPPDASFVPLRCGGAVMTDPYRDQAGFIDDTDVVGAPTAPAALRASDATNLYLRIRLDADPAPQQIARPSSWGVELDLDGDRTTYELLILVNGASTPSVVELFTNHTVTLPNDPNDPADQPAVASYGFAMNARSIAAAGAMTGGNPDFFLDFAVPWTDLISVGLDHATATRLWVASSSSADSLNGDFACHDGTTGPAHLDAADSDPTTGDPANQPPTGAGRLEGGGGCSTGTGSTSALFALALVATAGLRRRRR